MPLTFFDFLFYPLLFAALYAQVFLLITLFGMRDRKKITPTFEEAVSRGRRPDSLLPSVTVIVPCFNEEKTIAATVRSLLALDYPADKLRVTVVDDGSTDGTARAADPLRADRRVSLISKKENGGKHTALNAGLAAVETDLVACLDADSFAAPDSLRELVAAFADPSVMAATSTILVHHPRSMLERVQSAEYIVASLLRHILGKLNALFVTPGPLSVYRREVFEQIGGFSPGHQTEDLEMALRMQANHMRIAHVPESRVETVAPRTLRGLMRQRIRWHYGFLNNAFDYRRLIFRPSYGHIGVIAVPSALISIGASLAFAGSSVVNALSRLFHFFIEVSTVGFRWALPTFDWFFVASGPIQVLLVSALFLFGVFVIAAFESPAHRGHWRGSVINTICFFILYGFIAPLWYTRAVGLLIFGKGARWR